MTGSVVGMLTMGVTVFVVSAVNLDICVSVLTEAENHLNSAD
jgi:hypothetical protein